MSVAETFAARLLRARRARRYTRPQLDRAAHLWLGYVAQLEAATLCPPPVPILNRLAQALGVDAGWLLTGTLEED